VRTLELASDVDAPIAVVIEERIDEEAINSQVVSSGDGGDSL
jgi:hypothetical protein